MNSATYEVKCYRNGILVLIYGYGSHAIAMEVARTWLARNYLHSGRVIVSKNKCNFAFLANPSNLEL